jgi:thiazole synthase ThiGH ThiG subunit
LDATEYRRMSDGGSSHQWRVWGRELAKLVGQEDNNFVKLEAIPEAKIFTPDPIEPWKLLKTG